VALQPHITGVGLTPFGRHDGSTAVSLMAQAAQLALDDVGVALAGRRGAVHRPLNGGS